MAKFLVIIPLYNKASTILRSIQSVLDQDNTDFELLIIDDGSTDDSYAIARPIKSDKIEILRQKNSGVSATRNVGIKKAIELKAEYAAFLDADDYWMPDHLNELDKTIKLFPNAHIVANNYKQKISSKKFSKTNFSNWKHDQPEIVTPFFKKNFLNSIMTSSSYAMTISGKESLFYNESLSHTEDTDLMVRAGLTKTIAFNPKATVIVDQTAANRATGIDLNDRTIMDFDSYEEKAKHHKGLKKFLDINRFAIAIGYRLENDIKNATIYQHQIDTNNLTKKQRNLLTMSTRQLKALKRTQKVLGNLGFRLRTGR